MWEQTLVSCPTCEGVNSVGAWAAACNQRHSPLGEPCLRTQFAAEDLKSLLGSAHDPLEVPLLGENALQQRPVDTVKHRSLSCHEGPFPARTRVHHVGQSPCKAGEKRLGALFVLRHPANSASQEQPAAIKHGVQHLIADVHPAGGGSMS